jgi:anti-sigma factor (TIGR02949 family)
VSTSESDNGCNEAVRVLNEYLDAELTDERGTMILKHLDDCSGCFSRFEFETELRVAIASNCRATVPEDLRARIIAEIGF